MIVTLGVILVRCRYFSERERGVLLLSALVHFLGALAHVFVYEHLYGGGDMTTYIYLGDLIARYIAVDPQEHLFEAFGLFMQDAEALPFTVPAAGSSTGSMIGFGAFCCFGYSSDPYAISWLFGATSALAALVLYEVIRPELRIPERFGVLLALTMFPSTIFWTSAFLKEGVVCLPFALSIAGSIQLAEKRNPLVLVWLIPSMLVVGLIKPYALAPVIAAFPLYLIIRRAKQTGRRIRLRPIPTVFVGIFSVVGLVAFGRVFESFSFEQIGETLHYSQVATLRQSGTSTYNIGASGTSLLGQLVFTPVALMTALFRPFPWEVRNAQMAIAALETILVTFVFVRAVYRHGFYGLYRELLRRPRLIYLLVISLILALGVGLATTNFGALVRYRVLMYGIFAAAFLTLSRKHELAPANEDTVDSP